MCSFCEIDRVGLIHKTDVSKAVSLANGLLRVLNPRYLIAEETQGPVFILGRNSRGEHEMFLGKTYSLGDPEILRAFHFAINSRAGAYLKGNFEEGDK